MMRHFGKQPIVNGKTYELRDTEAQRQHRSPEHTLCRVRSVELSGDGCVRVGVAFLGPNDSSMPENVDTEGFALEPSCFCFPCSLRLATTEKL